MKYKHFLLIIFLFSICHTNSFAQINVGSIELVSTGPGNIESDNLEALKKTKTVFVFTSKDSDEQQAHWKKVFQDVWTITPVEFITYDKLNSYTANPDYSYFTIGGDDEKVKMATGGTYDNVHLYLTLWMNKNKKNGKPEKVTFCRIELFGTFSTLGIVTTAKKGNDPIAGLYKGGSFYNWYPGLQKVALKMVNDLLLKGETRYLYADSKNDEELKKLETETLYMPDYILTEMGGKRQDPDKLMKNYKGKYKIIPTKDLNDKILSGDAFYYLIFISSAADSNFSVYNNADGIMLCSRNKTGAYKMTEGDVKDLQKLVFNRK